MDFKTFDALIAARIESAAALPSDAELNPEPREVAYRVRCLAADFAAYRASTERTQWQTDRLKRLQRAVPAAVHRALAPAAWLAEARQVAEAALLAVAQPKERGFIPDFARTVTAEVLAGGFALRMRNPFPANQTLADFQAARAAMPAGDLFQNLFSGKMLEFEDLLADWVATVKDKDQRDARRTDAEIAEFIAYALLAPGGEALLVKRGRNQGKSVRDVFAPHIADWLAAIQTGNRLPAATVNDWLRLVLAAWRELARVKFPSKFRAELRALKGEL